MNPHGVPGVLARIWHGRPKVWDGGSALVEGDRESNPGSNRPLRPEVCEAEQPETPADDVAMRHATATEPYEERLATSVG